MIETIEQARESVANLNPAIDFGIIMCYPAANYAQYLWQAAYREATQGEAVVDAPAPEWDDTFDPEADAADYLDSLERDSYEPGWHYVSEYGPQY